jgi:hypothetical protein
LRGCFVSIVEARVRLEISPVDRGSDWRSVQWIEGMRRREEKRDKEKRVHNFGNIKWFFHDRSFVPYRCHSNIVIVLKAWPVQCARLDNNRAN